MFDLNGVFSPTLLAQYNTIEPADPMADTKRVMLLIEQIRLLRKKLLTPLLPTAVQEAAPEAPEVSTAAVVTQPVIAKP